MRGANFVINTVHVHDFHVRFIDQPRQPDADTNEAVDGSDHPPEQGR